MKNIAVLISGSGSNLRNLAEKCKKDLQNKCQISLVVSNIEGVGGLKIAEEYGLKSIVLQDLTKKTSIITKNISGYNQFAALKLESETAFNSINEVLKKYGINYSLQNLISDCLTKVTSISNFPEEDVKESVLSDVFFEALTKDLGEISEEKEEQILEKIDDILYSLIDEIKTITSLFHVIKIHPELINFFEREKYDDALHSILAENKIDYIFLAGFMRILSPSFTDKWKGKIFNIHPSLLPSFGGSKAVKEALEYGVKITGCTVHFVSSGVDDGSIIGQKSVEVLSTDTIETLHERIKLAEKELYPKILEDLINNKV